MLLSLVFWRSVWRTFFIQSCWNFERMQNLGFLFAILPTLREVWQGHELDAAVRRHIQFFNTHPYFAPLIIGAVSRLEEDWSNDKQGAERDINSLKLGLMGSLGAVGDSLFWAAARPFSAWAGVVLVLMGWPVTGLVAFLVLYNVPHLAVRIGGAATGYAAGIGVVAQLKRVNFPDMAQRVKAAAMFLAFAALPLLAWRAGPTAELRIGAVLLAGVIFLLVRRGAGGTRLAAGYLSLLLLSLWLWNTFGGNS
jgi:mannose/fructose/N-acetylgalactosamine-specific phosphotransferase system component IID